MKEDGEIKSWNDLKLEQRLDFKWMQPDNTIPSNWKNNLKHSSAYSQNLILLENYLVKSNS